MIDFYVNNDPKSIFLNNYYFSIYDNPKSSYATGSINLSSRSYKNFNDQLSDRPVINFKVHKEFLKKNKDILLTNNLMQKMGFNEVYKLFENAKHIFLIDISEMDNNKIIIKEVFFTITHEM